MNNNERRLLRADEVAREFAVTPRTVATWAKRGILSAVEVAQVASALSYIVFSANAARALPRQLFHTLSSADAVGMNTSL